ncbi:hypothetical protein [Caldimonas brevitalea]|uniref:Uncharacterized protein n=1 Tax=Caldimonas brevitalea TaxID=413882 RepID=A0A0G3BHV7_9BURK|nr:hypothetical protein [Caldimonas brevitalea]AKJ28932.1 hypothetical protein AAW51_2241 [Caldimonas brevitalea]
MWRVEFCSDEFLPCLPEECQTNPGVYGFELAFWLARALAAQGFVTSYPMEEDWGWFIEYTHGELEVTVGCCSAAEEGAGYTGKPVEWSIFARPHRSLLRRLRNTTSSDAVVRLTDAIFAALSSKGIKLQNVDA